MDTPVTVAAPRKAALVFIFAIVLLDVIALGIVIPVLPKLIETMLGGDTPRAAEIFGFFGTAWALMQFIFSPVLGALSDRYGRRPVLLISMTGHGLDYILMALAPSLAWLFVGRIVSGITAASFSTAYAYIADVTPPEKRAGAFGMVGAAFGIGFVLGPALGGLLGTLDPRLPFWVAAAFSLANAAYGWFVLPESLPRDPAHGLQLDARQPGRVAAPALAAPRAAGHGGRGVPLPARPRRAAVGDGALHLLSLRLGQRHHGADAGRRRRRLRHRPGRPDPARRRPVRRAHAP